MNHDKVSDYDIYFNNEREFKTLRREIFDRNAYYFETENDKPLIFDIGAHIGMASLYFARLFPQAKIVAVEPNPENLNLLETNIAMNRLEDRIEIVKKAVSNQTGTATLYIDDKADAWHSNGRLEENAWDGTIQNKPISVETITLNDLIKKRADFVKMDIEGSEQIVLEASKRAIQFIQHTIIEYHPVKGNKIETVHELLAESGMDVHVFKKGIEIRPFRARGSVIIEGKRL